MGSPIGGLGMPQPPQPPTPGIAAAESSSAEHVDFQDLLLGSLQQVEGLQQSAQTSVEKGLAGDDITQIEMMTAVKKADMALRMMIQVRNKIFEAYDEIKQLRM